MSIPIKKISIENSLLYQKIKEKATSSLSSPLLCYLLAFSKDKGRDANCDSQKLMGASGVND